MTITLSGCEPRPMAGYLKALGVFRILATQVDPKVTACWKDGVFVLSPSREEFDEAALVRFFRDEYAPTPFVAPWNKGSRFYTNDDAPDRILAERENPRFSQYAEIIEVIRSLPETPYLSGSVGDLIRQLKDIVSTFNNKKKIDEYNKIISSLESTTCSESSTPNKSIKLIENIRKKYSDDILNSNKEMLLQVWRSTMPDASLEWLDAAFSLSSRETKTSPFLLSGGNDGNMEFSLNFMQQCVSVLIDTKSEGRETRLRGALFAETVRGLPKTKMGFFAPGAAGGVNQGEGVEEENVRTNPWDYILMLEGCPFFATSASGREGYSQIGLSAPFFARLSESEQALQEEKDKTPKYEVWLPIWKNFARYTETRRLFAEGRASVERRRTSGHNDSSRDDSVKRRQARTGTDFARAVSTLGVDRGIASFERYAYLRRRGRSFVAVPLGSFKVRDERNVSILSETDEISSALRKYVRKLKSTPAALEEIRNRIENATFTCAQFPEPRHFGGLIRAYGRLEKYVALQNSPEKKPDRPFGGTLSPEWIGLCDDGTPEIRLAASLASITSSEDVGTIRTTLSGVDADNPRSWGKNSPLRRNGASFPDLIAGLLSRRLLDAARLGFQGIPLKANLAAGIEDVMLFLRGETDDERIEEYLWGFLWIRRPGTKNHEKEDDDDTFRSLSKKWNIQPSGRPFSRLYGLFKLLYHPNGACSTVFKREPRILPLLTAGRTDEALDLAVRRLCISGLKPLPLTIGEAVDPVRLAAALAFPLDNRTIKRMTKTVLAPQKDDNTRNA